MSKDSTSDANGKKSLSASLGDLMQQGILGPLAEPRRKIAPVGRKRGALARFLDSRT